ncbi:MAG: hypothetical protein M3281_06865 [Chloroflexota bacterium]|nr:hypothetical protein [Chloroflexota bacterium]
MYERMHLERGRAMVEGALREAELDRLLKQTRSGGSGVRVRALLALAEAMVALGRGLKARYAPAGSSRT